MCDAVPTGSAIAWIGCPGGGKLLPHTGNARPHRGRWRRSGRDAPVIDRMAAHFSVRNPALPRGTAIAPALIMKCMLEPTLRLLMLGLPAIGAAVTGPIADLAALQSAAEHAVRHEIPPGDAKANVRVQDLDARLRLAECDRPLTAAISGDGQLRAHTTVAVRCEGTVHWTIYMSVTIDSEFSVLVARHAIARDAELTATDFELMPRHLPGLTTDYVTQPAMIAGQRLRKTLAGGEALSLEALTPSNAIHRGQQVTLIAVAGGFEVRMSAVALSDGRLAERIRVQNLSSQRVVEGIVRSDSVVEVPL
jgi:flagella basal body P-ring formation protein FlgA